MRGGKRFGDLATAEVLSVPSTINASVVTIMWVSFSRQTPLPPDLRLTICPALPLLKSTLWVTLIERPEVFGGLAEAWSGLQSSRPC